MIPRSLTDIVTPDTTIDEARQRMATAHNRYPVVDEEMRPSASFVC